MDEWVEREHRGAESVGSAVGPIAALAAAGLLSRFRDTAGATNVALVLAAIVVVAALTGRMAGFVTAVTASLAFNYFHTQPYHSLRIDGTRDVVTVSLLAVIGVVVSEISAWRRRAGRMSAQRLTAGRTLERTTWMLANGDPSAEIWTAIREVLIRELHLTDCRFETTETVTLPVLPRSGSIVGPSTHLTRYGFALPPAGAVIPVDARGQHFGWIVLVPDQGRGSTYDARALAIALADQYALALHLDGVAAAEARRRGPVDGLIAGGLTAGGITGPARSDSRPRNQ